MVKSDQYPEIDLEKFDTYEWATHAQLVDNAVYALNDLILKAKIVKAVESELKGLGFDRVSTNPDLIINFIVFEEPTEFIGYAPANEDNYYKEYWDSFGPGEELGPMKKYEIQSGTLLIQLFSPEEKKIVWQGYASGIMDGQVFDKSEERIAEAVELIFEEYDARADDYKSTGR